MAQDVADLAEALTELGQKDAAERLKQKNAMPVEIACSQPCLANYSAKLSMYAPVKACWLIKDDTVLFKWTHSGKS